VNYLLLTDAQQGQIALRRLLELEAEHAGIDLDLRLAAAAGIENDVVVNARNQATILARQIAILTSWIQPPAQDQEEQIMNEESANGQEPALAE
jgi:cytidylate kinase